MRTLPQPIQRHLLWPRPQHRWPKTSDAQTPWRCALSIASRKSARARNRRSAGIPCRCVFVAESTSCLDHCRTGLRSTGQERRTRPAEQRRSPEVTRGLRVLIVERARIVVLKPMSFATLRGPQSPVQSDPEEHFNFRRRLGPP